MSTISLPPDGGSLSTTELDSPDPGPRRWCYGAWIEIRDDKMKYRLRFTEEQVHKVIEQFTGDPKLADGIIGALGDQVAMMLRRGAHD